MSLFKRRLKKKARGKTMREALLEEYAQTEQIRNLDDPKYKIGFGKGVRVGNVRLYKVMSGIGKDREDTLVVSGVQQGWRVYLPASTQQFGMIETLYADYVDGKKAGLMMYLSNMINVSLNIRADYQYLVNCIAQIYANPTGTVEKDGKKISIIDAVANDVRWIGENVQSEYYRDKEDEENSKEAEEQLKKDETYHKMLDEVEKMEKEEKEGKNDASKE